ncbi:hypothetical protein DFH09DRAFT_1086620 [Mycena vulgaris]|nr:hypothetical protein DFH09DRAFT_1086620 [Mycena vulgaris]
MLLDIPMHPVALTEALPFLVCTVGFDKPLRLARAVFTHPRAVRPAPMPYALRQTTYWSILRDYILEIAILLLGASSRVAGLTEVCALAALLLALDCLMMCTSLATIFCVMIEVRVIVLAISVLLNAYLIRGVGRARGGVHFEDGREEAKEHSEEAPAVKTEPKSEPETAQGSWARDIATAVDLGARRAAMRSRTMMRMRKTELEMEPRPLSELVALLESTPKSNGPRDMSDEEVVLLGRAGQCCRVCVGEGTRTGAGTRQDLERAVRVRRALISRASLTQALETSLVPFERYDYAKVLDACCENVGPAEHRQRVLPHLDGDREETLVASTSRGCKALNAGGGVTTVLTQDAMMRGPAIDFPSIVEAARWHGEGIRAHAARVPRDGRACAERELLHVGVPLSSDDEAKQAGLSPRLLLIVISFRVVQNPIGKLPMPLLLSASACSESAQAFERVEDPLLL